MRLLAFTFACFVSSLSIVTKSVYAQEDSAMAERMSVSQFFNTANKTNMKELVEQFYLADCEFEDPLVSLKGRDKVLIHYLNLYENVEKIHFDFGLDNY